MQHNTFIHSMNAMHLHFHFPSNLLHTNERFSQSRLNHNIFSNSMQAQDDPVQSVQGKKLLYSVVLCFTHFSRQAGAACQAGGKAE